jgi:hypothetical protein
MIINPKTITTDSMERALIVEALNRLINEDTKRLKRLKSESKISDTEDRIAHANDLVRRYSD